MRVPLGVLLLLVGLTSPALVEAVTIDEAVEAAKERDGNLGIAKEQSKQAQANLNRMRFRLLPSVQASGSYTLNQYEIIMNPLEWFPAEYAEFFPDDFEPTVIQAKDYFSANVRLDQAIFDARTLPGLRAAKSNYQASESDLNRVERLMKARVAQMAYTTQATRDFAALSKRSLELAKVQLDLATARKDLGGSSKRDHLQAQLAVSRALRDLRAAQASQAEAELAFAQLTGFERNVSLELDAKLDLPGSLQDAKVQALSLRQDLRASQSRQDSTHAIYRASRWAFLPSLNASLVGSYTENTMFSEYPTSWMGMLNAQWALWDGGATRSQKAIDAANWRIAKHASSMIRDQVQREVESSWLGLVRAREAYAAVQIEVDLATENLALAEAALPNGGASWIEVEQARLGLQAAQASALREEVALRLSEIAVLVAVGLY